MEQARGTPGPPLVGRTRRVTAAVGLVVASAFGAAGCGNVGAGPQDDVIAAQAMRLGLRDWSESSRVVSCDRWTLVLEDERTIAILLFDSDARPSGGVRSGRLGEDGPAVALVGDGTAGDPDCQPLWIAAVVPDERAAFLEVDFAASGAREFVLVPGQRLLQEHLGDVAPGDEIVGWRVRAADGEVLAER